MTGWIWTLRIITGVLLLSYVPQVVCLFRFVKRHKELADEASSARVRRGTNWMRITFLAVVVCLGALAILK